MPNFNAKMHQNRFRLGLRSPRPLLDLRGPTSKGREGRRGEGRGGKGRGGAGRGGEAKRREREGRGGTGALDLFASSFLTILAKGLLPGSWLSALRSWPAQMKNTGHHLATVEIWRLHIYGDRSFSVSGPGTWNGMPPVSLPFQTCRCPVKDSKN